MGGDGYDTLVSASCFHAACTAYIISCGLKQHAAGKKIRRGRGALQLRPGSIFWILGKPGSSVFSPYVPGVFRGTAYGKATAVKVRLQGDLSTNPQMTHFSLSIYHHATDDINTQTQVTAHATYHHKHSPEQRVGVSVHKTERESRQEIRVTQ